MTSKVKHSKIKLGILGLIHVICAFLLAYIALLVISFILPLAFEVIYALWIQLYYIFLPVSIIISSLLVILLPNPIYALLALIFVFLNTALFLLSMQIQFLAFIYLIVYIGAIAILFLFVIMLFNLRSLKKSDLQIQDFSFLTLSFKLYFFFGLKFFMILAFDICNFIEYSSYINNFTVYNKFDLQYFLTYIHWDILLFGNLFYTYYVYLFLISGLILLTAMIGSIVLALSTSEKI